MKLVWVCRAMLLVAALSLLVELLCHHRWRWCALGVFNVVMWAFHERAAVKEAA